MLVSPENVPGGNMDTDKVVDPVILKSLQDQVDLVPVEELKPILRATVLIIKARRKAERIRNSRISREPERDLTNIYF